MMPSHEKKMIMMIMMIKLPWRGRAETFPHTTEAEPKLSFFKIRISNAIAIVVILTYDEQQLSSPAQSSSASQVSWSSVRASSVASWHHHHPDIIIIQTSASSRHHHHPDILTLLNHQQTQLSFWNDTLKVLAQIPSLPDFSPPLTTQRSTPVISTWLTCGGCKDDVSDYYHDSDFEL